MPSRLAFMVIVKQAVPGVSQAALARFAQRARRAAGLHGQVNILLTSSRDLRSLNRRFRDQDKPTDVLSFPSADWLEAERGRRSPSHSPLATSDPLPAAGRLFSGDIAISTDIAVANARLHQHAPAQELKILILHGMLHLAGYDHESDRGQMARQEERLRRQLGLSDGLIRRTVSPKSSVASRQETSNASKVAERRPSTVDRRRSR